MEEKRFSVSPLATDYGPSEIIYWLELFLLATKLVVEGTRLSTLPRLSQLMLAGSQGIFSMYEAGR